jgi:AcrR family transcriptional regulator
MARTTRTDWLEEGLAILRQGGDAALTVEKLCASLERTKGSFYHHFKDAGAYLDSLLEHWEAKNTSAPIQAATASSTAIERRHRLNESVRVLDMKLEVAVRAWALRDERAERALRRVDARRIDYLAELYTLLHGKGPVARQLAEIEYAAFVGMQQLFPDLSARRYRALYAVLERALDLVAKDQKG